MAETIEVKDNIQNSFKDFSDMLNNLDKAKTLMESIDADLKEKAWSGDAHEKCCMIHALLTDYFNELLKMSETLQKNVKELKKNADDFTDASVNVRLIKTV